jgi:hypothetical protein
MSWLKAMTHKAKAKAAGSRGEDARPAVTGKVKVETEIKSEGNGKD